MARHHTFDDVIDDELDYLTARVSRPFDGLCHDSHISKAHGIRIGHIGSLDTVAIRVRSQLSCEDGVGSSFEEVVQHCLLERSRVCSQSWDDMSQEHVGPSDDIMWALFSFHPADIGPDSWGERIFWVEPELERHQVVSVEGYCFFFKKR
jgi:hypothetical protein